MLFFKTIDVTVPVESVSALSRHGSTLNIYINYNDKPIQSKPEGDWELEDYTQQWEDLCRLQQAGAATAIPDPAPVAVKVPQGNIPSKADYVDPTQTFEVNGS